MKVIANFCQSHIEEALEPLKHIPFTLHGDSRPSPQDLSINPINIYYHSEPDEYFGNHTWIRENANKFAHILTLNPDIIRDFDHAIFTPFGTSPYWNKSYYRNIPRKENKVTFIRGAKHANVTGHHLRWELFDRQGEIRLPHQFYDRTTPEYARNDMEEIQWFSQRNHIFGTPLFHIAIENTANTNYFTEKIMDCFLWKTLPIYYGCPNIHEFFDGSGIITFNTVDELIHICNTITPDDYFARFSSIEHNQREAQKYIHLGSTILHTLTDLFTTKYPGYLKS